MTISATMVRDLREKTGAGIMECKAALAEAGGDMENAIDVLRKRGLKVAEKKAGRVAADGLVAAWTSPDGTAGALVEVNCETDFVARTEKFAGLAQSLVAMVGAEPAAADGGAYLARCGRCRRLSKSGGERRMHPRASILGLRGSACVRATGSKSAVFSRSNRDRTPRGSISRAHVRIG